MINRTYIKITSKDRKKVKMFDSVSVKEAITNAFVHNLWEREYPPKFEIFRDHIAISSTGGLPLNVSKNDFLNGFSAPTHLELMRVFKDLDMVDQLGTGVIRILKSYSGDVYRFSGNFIRVNFQFKSADSLENSVNEDKVFLTDDQEKIVKLIKNNPGITQQEMSEKLDLNITAVSKNLSILKNKKILRRIGSNKNGQ